MIMSRILAKPIRHIFLTVGIVSVTSSGWAGRPLVTEDAGLLGRGSCEVESFVAKASDLDLKLGWAQIGCGIGMNTQLALGVGRETSSEPSVNYAALLGKTSLRTLTEEDYGVVIAYTILGGKESGGDFNYASTEIKAVLTVPHQGWFYHANAGVLHTDADSDSRAIWAFAAERPNALGPVALMGEVFGVGDDAPWFQVAARWPVIEDRFFLDASWGKQINTSNRVATVGLKFAF